MPNLPNLEKIGILLAALLASLALVSFTLPPGAAVRGPAGQQVAALAQGLPHLVRTGESALAASAETVLIERLASGEVLWERNADLSLPIASLTKLMTALALAEQGGELDYVLFSAEAKTAGDADEKRSAVAAGERIKAEDVLKMLLISSDNDAAYAAAEHVARRNRPELAAAAFEERLRAFVALMNERAGALGLADTRFANPGGSDDPENYSTARDLARLAALIARERPDLWAISRIRETFVFGASGGRYGLVNTNPLLGEFPAIHGSKTGYDDQARGTLLVLYQLAPGDPVAIIILNSRDRFADGRAAIQWLESNFTIASR